MKEYEIIERGLYSLKPKSDKDYDNWCKHNLLVASKKDGKLVFTDTYWSSYQDQTIYTFEEIKDCISFVFDLNPAIEVSEKEYDQYEDKDKFYIPVGGTSAKYLIDSRANKSREKIIELIEHKISTCQSSIKSLQYDIERNTEQLARVKAGGSIDNLFI